MYFLQKIWTYKLLININLWLNLFRPLKGFNRGSNKNLELEVKRIKIRIRNYFLA